MIDASPATTPEIRRKIVLWCVQSALGVVGYGVILCLAAWSLRWVWGWVLLAITAVVLATHVIILVPINPALLAEREEGFRAKGTKRWDKWVVAFSATFGTVVLWVLAGLDFRFGWSGSVALAVNLVGGAAYIAGYAIFLWAVAVNAFFAEGVRIQTERGHTVATGGPYRVVRHPGYVGAMLSGLATPFLLGSWWALIPAGLAVLGYVIRTALEDRTLRTELAGYEDYTNQTRYRLIPGIW